MPLWTFQVLSLLSLLWWLDTGSVWAWICWVAAALVMLGMHTLGMIDLGLQAVLLLGSGPLLRRRWRGFLAGIVVVLAEPAVYYLVFNHWFHTVQQQGWASSGLNWIGEGLENHGGTSVVLNCLCIFWDSWGWIDRGVLPQGVAAAEAGCFVLLLGAVALGLIPWKSADSPTHASGPALPGQLEKPVLVGRAALWLTSSIVVPSFVCYCAVV